jgi:hypothetical protein
MFSNIFTIVILYFVYGYLAGLKNCDCVQLTYVNKLKYIELFFLLTNVFTLLFGAFSITFLHFNKKMLMKVYSAIAFVMLAIYCYFAYNTYYFSSTMGNQCVCADKWQKYFIYGQSTVTAVILLSTGIFAMTRLF